MNKWARSTLKKVATLMKDGDWIQSKDQATEGIRLIQSGNIADGRYSDKLKHAKFIDEETCKHLNCTEVFEGDVLVSRLPAPIGRACILPPSTTRRITVVDCTIIRFDQRVCLPEYFVFFSMSLNYYAQVAMHVAGSTRVRISRKNLEAVEIPLPPLETQQHIAKILQAVSELLALRQQQLVYLDEIINATFNNLFSKYFSKPNCYMLLSEVCKFIDYRGRTPERSENGIPLITAKNIKNNAFSFEPREYISLDTYNDFMTRGFPQTNDIVFTTEAPLGNVCRIPKSFDRFAVGQRIIVMQPFQEILISEYMEYALASSNFQKAMLKCSSGSTVRGVRSKELIKLSIPVPPLAIQNQFAQIVSKIEENKILVQKAMEEADYLLKSLINLYFN